MRISYVVTGSRPVTAELALLFGKAFGQTPQYWLDLQARHDLDRARQTIGLRINAVKPVPEGEGQKDGGNTR